ncbi:hypothetical protein RB620_13785 [Paenibacillus sp. LHD-117]|uniref:hypothetical protein n=1 Tax=Paenibacillus sp. LHD-117 TaxID=3071412 RepID=UPI0027E05817|nr:hypothetical protein [Paenibacillus sp. LHD-117]MDQ6420508.1 hypothetical protein [Paenibacillus sp. LHD-117]
MEDNNGNPFFSYMEVKISSVLQGMFERKAMDFNVYHTMTSAEGAVHYSDMSEENGGYRNFQSVATQAGS